MYKLRYPLLHTAIIKNDIQIAKMLIDYGADVEELYKNITPLYLAVTQKRYEILRYLLEKKADPNSLLTNFATDIFNYVDVEICKLLIEFKADFNIEDSYQRTLIFYAIKKSNYELVKLLVEYGIDLTLKDNIYHSYLNVAALHSDDTSILELLINNGIDINTCNWIGRTPLHLFVIECNTKAVNILLSNGACIHVEDNYGKEPIYYAVSKHNDVITKLLLQYGANPNSGNERGSSLLNMAVTSNNLSLVDSLLYHGARVNEIRLEVTPLIIAVNYYNINMVNLLIRYGADVNQSASDGRTPLHIASLWNKIGMVKILLDNGSDINNIDHYDKTPLCIRHASKEVATLIISRVVLAKIYNDSCVNTRGFLINMDTIEQNSFLTNIMYRCIKEINILKRIPLSKSQSLDILLMKNPNVDFLIRFLYNPKVKTIEKKLNIYQSIICKIKTKCYIRNTKLRKVISLLRYKGYFSYMPIELIKYVLKLLNNNDINTIIKAYSK
ncbi:ankyrin repeat family protein [Flamingopox virus FGPVKD09]|uniref:Ankyrin repeat family protein n=1 Tax=Flamingopox virus FGPVKD09 TaxID=2059380 RepID=A0A2H4X237_9POXV|nr:ankyrin repeat family protein [Flamingopox virus FGPVKD09]AUD40128.1 ankyrin repeat family protein [Flamingopox virus FGPVKD09]